MIDDEFAAIVHGEYRRHELLAAVMRRSTTPRRTRQVGAARERRPLGLLRRIIGRGPRIALQTTKP